jgi:hypothetical protein
LNDQGCYQLLWFWVLNFIGDEILVKVQHLQHWRGLSASLLQHSFATVRHSMAKNGKVIARVKAFLLLTCIITAAG